jgi:endonuclease/exonuclease/phosphatase family metal-dependent hydrolase
MIEDLDYFDDLDRKFLNLGSKMSDVFSWTYGWLGYRLVAPLDPNKFDNATTKAKEIGIRAMIVVGAVAGFVFAATQLFLTGVVLGAGSKLVRELGYYFQKAGFTHVRGSAQEKEIEKGEAKLMTWNVRGYRWLPYEKGLVHWRSRIEGMLEKIKNEDPDVLVFQEVYDTAMVEALVKGLEGHYAHFYTHLGVKKWGEESGCVIVTKCPVHNFKYTDFSETDSEVNRGFGILEIKAKAEDSRPFIRIVGAQLSPGPQDGEIRLEQAAQIVDTLARQKLALPTFFAGSKGDKTYLANYLQDSYRGQEATSSPEFAVQWDPVSKDQEQSTDDISLFKAAPSEDRRTFPVVDRGVKLIKAHLVRAFDDTYDTKTSLSDHHGLVATIKIER